MVEPTFADYVQLLYTLFEQFVQQQAPDAHRGHPFVYRHKVLIVFFVIMQCLRIFQFKTQHRWLRQHPERRKAIGMEAVPDRTTLSRRSRALYTILPAFIAFLGQYAEALDPVLSSADLYEDKSLFKAQGPVWHQADRQAGRIPNRLRRLDTDATWSKSAYHGWVYGYALHLTCNAAGFPKLVQVETAAVSESQVIDQKEPRLIAGGAPPSTVTGDNSYTQASRIRRWAKQGVTLLTPALKWVKGRYAEAYHHFLTQPENVILLKRRRTAIEPAFDLVAKVIGATDNHKQLPIQKLANVRTCLTLATLTVQFAMFANNIWGLPLRDISHLVVVFT